MVDPIDDTASFEETKFDFVIKEGKIYKKSKTHRHCDGKFVDIEYYQNFSGRIDLNSYKEFDKTYFTTKGVVYFWWVNSDGHLMIPINDADSETFEPFEKVCGGVDKKGVYYGCPNYGVYQLDISKTSKFEFIPKENNYWNSPNHFVIVDNKVYDIKYEYKKGYFIQLNETVSKDEILKTKK